MESKTFTESGLTFDFSACKNPYKADTKERNYNRLSSVVADVISLFGTIEYDAGYDYKKARQREL